MSAACLHQKTNGLNPSRPGRRDVARAPRTAGGVLSFALLAVLSGASSRAVAADAGGNWRHYELGHGYSVPSANLTIGGYFTLRWQDPHHKSSSLDTEDASMFLSWNPAARTHVFSEIEIGQGLTLDRHGLNTHNAEFDLERLYVDYDATNRFTLRFGKFLTPIGHWNLIHASPLVWTTSRPLVTERIFAQQSTGAMVYGTLPLRDDELDYIAYADDTNDLDPKNEGTKGVEAGIPPTDKFMNAYGFRLVYHMFEDSTRLGLSYSSFHMHGFKERKHLVGVDGTWSRNGYELSSEFAFRASEEGNERAEWGGFVQGVAPLFGHLYGVARGEWFNSRLTRGTATIGTFGLAYRPVSPLVFKLEYHIGDNNDVVAPDSWLASMAVLF